MGKQALSPETKASRLEARLEERLNRQSERASRTLALNTQRQEIADEMRRLVSRFAPSAPRISDETIHHYRLQLCLGKTGVFWNIGRWYGVCGSAHNGGSRCGKFRWFSDPLPKGQLVELERLRQAYENLGRKYGESSRVSPVKNSGSTKGTSPPEAKPSTLGSGTCTTSFVKPSSSSIASSSSDVRATSLITSSSSPIASSSVVLSSPIASSSPIIAYQNRKRKREEDSYLTPSKRPHKDIECIVISDSGDECIVISDSEGEGRSGLNKQLDRIEKLRDEEDEIEIVAVYYKGNGRAD